MPGGRLTYEERNQVAAGLAEGLSYAEIARRLSRPTSTVSRDVTRNGGRSVYRAEQADQATRSRAQRRRTLNPRAPSTAAGAPGRDPAAVRELEETFTALIVRTGLSRMTARVLACLYTADSGSHTAADLVRRLHVSPASVSKAIGELEAQELVKRERETHLRRDRYVIDGELWHRSWLASAQMNAALADTARHGAQVLGTTSPAGTRLHDMSQFLHQVGHDMVQAAERWKIASAQPATDPRHGETPHRRP